MNWINYNNEWKDFFDIQFSKPYFKQLLNKVEIEYKNQILYPSKQDIFKVFNLCKLSNLKVIILGQDPYHTPGVANGIAFSTNPKSNYMPPSLKNIFKELYKDLRIYRTNTDLTDWLMQGVLLINSILTVYKNKPLSCKEWNWQQLIIELIQYLNSLNDSYIYVLLGNNAKSYAKYINTKKDHIITSSHPSPLSYYQGFCNSKIFSKINNLLISLKKTPINW